VLTKYNKTRDKGLSYFIAYKTTVWQCFTEGQEDLFQGNFANNTVTKYGWRDLTKLDGNL